MKLVSRAPRINAIVCPCKSNNKWTVNVAANGMDMNKVETQTTDEAIRSLPFAIKKYLLMAHRPVTTVPNPNIGTRSAKRPCNRESLVTHFDILSPAIKKKEALTNEITVIDRTAFNDDFTACFGLFNASRASHRRLIAKAISPSQSVPASHIARNRHQTATSAGPKYLLIDDHNG